MVSILQGCMIEGHVSHVYGGDAAWNVRRSGDWLKVTGEHELASIVDGSWVRRSVSRGQSVGG